MKKLLLYSTIVAASMLMTACNDDYTDWNDPQGYSQDETATINFQASSVGAMDLRSISDEEIQIFNPTLTCNKDYTATYKVAIYNDDKTDSVVVNAAEGGMAKRAEVQGAMVALFGTDEVQRTAPMVATAYVTIEGTAVRKVADGLTLTATPKFQEMPPVWYIVGNCIGRGTWINHKTMAKYLSTVAMYVNPYNYEELVYASLMQDGTEFYIAPELGNKKNIIGADESGNIWYQDDTSADAATPKNISIKEGGYYKITVNVRTYEVTWEPISGEVKYYTDMAITGIDAPMQIITKATKGENHDWLGDLTVTEDGSEVGFAGTGDEGLSTAWGGKAFPAGKAIVGGAAIPAKAGTYKVVFNDLLGLYRFIEE
ncbi:MAG: hypothetical protein J6S96_08205 [Muribaculaceae bacterium]|nr:hypothetical protein [Muribaculaceae bacterium]